MTQPSELVSRSATYLHVVNRVRRSLCGSARAQRTPEPRWTLDGTLTVDDVIYLGDKP